MNIKMQMRAGSFVRVWVWAFEFYEGFLEEDFDSDRDAHIKLLPHAKYYNFYLWFNIVEFLYGGATIPHYAVRCVYERRVTVVVEGAEAIGEAE